jgi:hypothetical protein
LATRNETEQLLVKVGQGASQFFQRHKEIPFCAGSSFTGEAPLPQA